jgi:hypothetical protein
LLLNNFKLDVLDVKAAGGDVLPHLVILLMLENLVSHTRAKKPVAFELVIHLSPKDYPFLSQTTP